MSETTAGEMRPEDVPGVLVQAAADAIHAHYAAHPQDESEATAIRVVLAAALTALGLRQEWGNEYLDGAGLPMFGPAVDEQTARWQVGHFPLSGPVRLARRWITKPEVFDA